MKWPNVDPNTKRLVEQTVHYLSKSLGDNVTAIYLHGSLAFGCYHPPKSDVDLLVVIRELLNLSQQKEILRTLVAINDKRKITGSLELSIVLAEHARKLEYPIPFELHFGENHANKIRSDTYDFAQVRGSDPDLAAHFTVCRHVGINLLGSKPTEVLGNVAWESYLDAIITNDLDWILENENILSSPFYGVLNTCRVIQTVKTGKGTIVSKEQGGLWALEHLPSEHHRIIHDALAAYRSSNPVSPQERRTAGMTWDKNLLLLFRDYVRSLQLRRLDS